MSEHLHRMLNAKSIAVIGASTNPSKRGYHAISRLIAEGYKGEIFPINPNSKEILGLKSYQSVTEIPVDIDLALICTGATTLPEIITECGKKKIPGVVVLAAGFSEVGDDGDKLAVKTLEIARKFGVRVIGPNTNGIFNLHNNMNLVGIENVAVGKIGVCSQSGNMLVALVLEVTKFSNLGFSSYVGVGNQLDIDFAELLEFFGDDSNTQGIVCYIEGITNGKKFLDICQQVTLNKPIVVLKSGRTSAGQNAAASHTGSIASSYTLTRCVLKQAGVIVVEQSDLLLSIVNCIANLPSPKTGRVAVLTDGGGHGTIITDALVESAVSLSKFSTTTKNKLQKILPSSSSVTNPVDVAGGTDSTPNVSFECAEVLLADENVNILVLSGMYGGFAARFNPKLLVEEVETSQKLVSLITKYQKPVIIQSIYNELNPKPIQILKENNVPIFTTPERASLCIANLISYEKDKKRLQAPRLNFQLNTKSTVHKIFSTAKSQNRNTLYEYEAKQVLTYHNIQVPNEILVQSEKDLLKIPEIMKDDLLSMKIVSQDILHKTDAGCVKLNLSPNNDLLENYQLILSNAHLYFPNADIEGVLVSPMVKPGIEIIVGFLNDPTFGPVIMFGSGGIFVENTHDISFRSIPFMRQDIHEMIHETKISGLIYGSNRLGFDDANGLENLITKVSKIASSYEEIAEIDLNPVILNQEGIHIVDSRIILN